MNSAAQTSANPAVPKIGIAGGIATVLLPSVIFLLCKAEDNGIFVLAGAVGLLFAFLSIAIPKVWAYSTTILLPLYLISRDTAVNPLEIVVYSYLLGGLLFWIIDQIFIKRNKVVQNAGDFFLFMFLAFAACNCVIAILNDTDLLDWFKEYSVYFLYLLYLPYRHYFKTEKDIKRLLIFFAISMIIVAVYQIYYFKTLIMIAAFAYQLQSTLRINLTILAFSAVLGILGMFYYKERKLKILMLLLTICALAIVVTSFARTTWIMEMLMIVLVFFLLDRRKKIIAASAAFVAVIAIIITLYLMLGNLDIYFQMIGKKFQTTSSGKKDPSLQARLYEYDAVFRAIEQNPISGNGIGKKFAHKDILKSSMGTLRKSYIHNSYLQLLYNVGLPTTLMMVFFLLFYYFKSIRLTFFSGKKINLEEKIYPFLAFVGITIVMSHAILSPQLISKESTILLVYCCFLCTHQSKNTNAPTEQQQLLPASSRDSQD